MDTLAWPCVSLNRFRSSIRSSNVLFLPRAVGACPSCSSFRCRACSSCSSFAAERAPRFQLTPSFSPPPAPPPSSPPSPLSLPPLSPSSSPPSPPPPPPPPPPKIEDLQVQAENLNQMSSWRGRNDGKEPATEATRHQKKAKFIFQNCGGKSIKNMLIPKIKKVESSSPTIAFVNEDSYHLSFYGYFCNRCFFTRELQEYRIYLDLQNI